jgi:predicted DNA-binding transcriptional regulator AlpA
MRLEGRKMATHHRPGEKDQTMATSLRHRTTYDVKAVAQLWGQHPSSIYRMAKAGTLPVAPIRVGGSLRWSRVDVNESVGLAADADPFVDDESQ